MSSSPVPAKSQPLHNFSLPPLKWLKSEKKNHHRGRRLAASSPPPPKGGSASSESESPENRRGSAREGGYFGVLNSSSDHVVEKSEKKSAAAAAAGAEGDGGGAKEVRSTIRIRFTTKSKVLNEKPDDVQSEEKIVAEGGEAEDFFAEKSWNLRPRKPMGKLSNETKALQQTTSDFSFRFQGGGGGGGGGGEAEAAEKKGTFSIELSRQEIEEDIFAMTGAKPSRRPRKRPKSVQKQLDDVFPGLWLSTVTPDSYKVEAPTRKG